MNKTRVLALASILVAAAAMLAIGLLRDVDFTRSSATYGNYDLPGKESWVMKLMPGVPDLASIKVYGELHIPPLVFIGILFAFMLVVSVYGNAFDLLYRKAAQWTAFALARMGVLRVSGLCPLSRTSFGTFGFLNCQACEMTTGACPIGMIQWSLMHMRFPFLAVGIVLMSGAVLGRAVCGWLCPFGFLSDAFDRASLKKYRLPFQAGYLKFLVLLLIFTAVAWPSPYFCAVLCQSGSMFGLLPYYLTTGLPALRLTLSQGGWEMTMLGYHIFLGSLFAAGAVLVSGRWFCRYLCPLGAWYGLFNYLSPLRVAHHEMMCSHCRACSRCCPMDVDLGRGGFLDVTGCIRCGRCIKACSMNARSFSISFGPAPVNVGREEVHEHELLTQPQD
ncbi:MAG TPA: 4Fe-4S binding protein [Methanotrichaceae archaeon]|nr:4Fe-4S binding protein [Methanotrichaceae archaeon]